MKLIPIITFLFLSFSFFGCSKDKTPQEESQQNIIGKWILYKAEKYTKSPSGNDIVTPDDDLEKEFKTLDFKTSNIVDITGYKLNSSGKKEYYEVSGTFSMSQPYSYQIKLPDNTTIFPSLELDNKTLIVFLPKNVTSTKLYFNKK